MPTKTLITGASGFTGRYLAKHLKAQGDEVHGLGHAHGAPDCLDAGHYHSVDIANAVELAKFISDLKPTRIVHLAAIAFVAHADIAEMYRANILGTRNLLEACLPLKDTLTSLLIASSANVYGNTDVDPITESAPFAPTNDYSVTKVAMEYLAHTYQDRLPITIVRPFNYTGAGQSPSFLVPKIVKHVLDRAPRIELGNLDVARDISDVRSVVDIYGRILANPSLTGATLNICSGRAITLRSLLDLAMDISGHRMEIYVNPDFVRANEVRYLRGSPERLQASIGPVDMIPIEETMRWMIEGGL